MFVDENAKFISPDLMIAVLGHYFLERRGEKGIVLQDIRSSKAVGEYLAPMGAEMRTWKVGRAFAEMTGHIIKEHKCKKIYFLSGQADNPVSGQRIEGYKSAMTAHGLDVTDDMIFYGDFWYTGGEMLADRIASGDVPMPEAVVCASDHMAIGLANRLAAKGIKVPEQVIVTGYDGIPEAVLNDITITTCVPDVKTAAAKAVNMLRKEKEPHSELKPASI